jgi:sugar lactone lactonase YvrE
VEPAKIIEVGNTLGEGVLWDVETQSLWWTDIQERRLYRYDWNSRSLNQFITPERLCSFGFIQGSSQLIAAFESGFALYDAAGNSTTWLARPELDRPGIRLNDGRVDCQGRFWAGGMAETDAAVGKARLYCLDGTGRMHIRESGITVANSICWSPDSTGFYFADSQRRTIWRYAFDAASGEISDRRIFAQTPSGASPDGAAVDSEGFLWCAQWGAGRVARYAPGGHIERVLELPVSQPSCVTFGGPNLDLLFVTSARVGLSRDALARHPGAGNVFVYNVGITGLPEGRFLLSGSDT